MSKLEPQKRYDTKTIKYRDNKGTSVAIMLTLFEGEGNSALAAAGWTGTYLMMSNMEGGVNYSTTNIREFADRIEAIDDNYLRLFLESVMHGPIPFNGIEDGGTYDPERIKIIGEEWGLQVE